MTDKIRIVGAFGEGIVDQVEEFVGALEGVQHVEVLRDGAEIYAVGDRKTGVPVTDQAETADEAATEPATDADETPAETEA